MVTASATENSRGKVLQFGLRHIPPHIETQTPAQREASIRALLRQVEATTEPEYFMSNSSDKAATKIGKVIKGIYQGKTHVMKY